MNDAASATAAAANTTDPAKMMNGGWQQNGLPNGFGNANAMMMNGAGQFQPGQQFPGQQQGFRQPGMPGQQPQHFNGQQQPGMPGSQFAPLSHPGAMPNLRQGPNPGMAGQQQQQPQRPQGGMGMGPTELQTMQNKALQQHYQRMLSQQGVPNAGGVPGQQQTPNPGQQQQQQPPNLGQNLTPYQQQQVMLQYQQQQREAREQHQVMLAQRQAMVMAQQHQAQQGGQQPLAPQLSGQQQQQQGQFQAPLAPQNTGGSVHQQQGMIQPQHSGQQNGVNGVGAGAGAGAGGAGVNPAMLFQQAQFKQQQQQGMMNGLGQVRVWFRPFFYYSLPTLRAVARFSSKYLYIAFIFPRPVFFSLIHGSFYYPGCLFPKPDLWCSSFGLLRGRDAVRSDDQGRPWEDQ